MIDAPDPTPGDFDAELERIDLSSIEIAEPSERRVVSIQLTVHGVDAERLQRIADARGKKPGDVVAELLRDADRSAA